MTLLESGENYLEMILVLTERNGQVRSIDIANAFDFSKASVSRAMTILKNNNYITMERCGNIHLTQQGLAHAQSILEKHHVLTRFLEQIGVSSSIAESDACRIEHIISDETFTKIKEQLK